MLATSTPQRVEEVVVPQVVETVEQYAERLVTEKWGKEQWDDFHLLIKKESGWNPLAKNPKSSAFGLGQFLSSTWQTVGCEKTDDPKVQIDCTIKYVDKNYGTPEKAISFHRINNFY